MSHRLFGLIGFPLSHSFSGTYFNEKFSREGINDSAYELFPITSIADFPELLKQHPQLCGLNVTIPYKEQVIPYLDELSPVAEQVGAVNCIQFIRETGTNKLKLIGHNTDVFGFRQSIKPFLESQHERALILGSGGASKAVKYVLEEIGIDCYLVSRDKENLDGQKGFSYDELNEYVMKAFKLIVNTTPLGMYPNTEQMPGVPLQFIGKGHLVVDLIYNPEKTLLLQEASKQGAVTMNGLSMLKQQAEAAWSIWNS